LLHYILHLLSISLALSEIEELQQLTGKETFMKRVGKMLLCAAALAMPAMLGCTQDVGDFTLLATKNVDLTNLNTQAAENAQKVSGLDKRGLVFGYGTYPNMKDACDRAEESGNAVGLTNARLVCKYWTCIVYGEQEYDVVGYPIPR